MADVSVVGLGAMGSALARAFLGDGHRVTVWNRTSAKAERLVAEGASLAADPGSAVSASPTTVICVADYEVTRSIIGSDGAASALRDRLLVQLSTGSPGEARRGEDWASDKGAEYLDGAIMAFPDQIGTADALILVSGSQSAFRRAELLLGSLAGNISYLGSGVGAAAGLDCALLSFGAGAILGSIHGAQICLAEEIPLDLYGAMLAELAPVLGDEVKHIADTVHAGEYGNPQASLKTWTAAAERVGQQAQESSVNSEFPDFVVSLFGKGMAAGYGDEDVGALIKALRRGA